MTTRQAVQHTGEIRLGSRPVSFAVSMTVYRMAARSPPLSEPRNRKFLRVTAYSSQQPLRQIVVDAEPAVVDIAGQGIPAAQPILQCFAQRRFAGQLPSLSDRPDMECTGLLRVCLCIQRWSAVRPLMSASMA
jgi:hypothetical protein